ncbi:MAG: alkaline phosphatase [Gammaproteobacteria bacterium]|nr:alkaline phosphatase [Algicola sp.]NRA71464.1 alkaline phosphatase [Gammaproteobacteria bacterium]
MKNKKMLSLIVCSVLISACSTEEKIVEVEKIVKVEPTPVTSVKNVILMIGDGMGVQQVGLLEDYARRAPNSIYNSANNQTALSKFSKNGLMGLSMTSPHGGLVVDSACSATQLATGMPAGSEMIGLDNNGNIVKTILERAKAAGKATGLVSDTRITHATPASFAAHQPHRSLENDIAAQMIASESVDVLFSGGARNFLPSDIKTNTKTRDLMSKLGASSSIYKKSKRQDDRNIITEARDGHGYNLVFDKKQLTSYTGDKVLGLFANSSMSDGIAYTACKKANSCTQPSLTEMTMKALDILSRDPDGFFLMIEGGQIDWAGHINDAGWMLHELIKFDEAVEAVYQWVKDRDDTLVIVTADHETGGFGFSYTRKNLPKAKSLSGDGMLGYDFQPKFNFGPLETLDALHGQTGTFYDMMSHVNSDWDFSSTTAQAWSDAINAYSQIKVTPKQAQGIPERETNEYFVADHPYLAADVFPKLNDFKEFYVYGDDLHGNLMGRALAADQNVIWGTGTHTAAPVPVYAFGPQGVIKQFSTMQHHTDIGQKMIAALLPQ